MVYQAREDTFFILFHFNIAIVETADFTYLDSDF